MFDQCLRCCFFASPIYVKVAGPRYAGKTTIVRWLRNEKVEPQEPPASTEGTEISCVTFERRTLILYDSESHDEEDFATAKWVDLTPHSIQLKQPKGMVFVIDGSDPGRLALASIILRDTVERLHSADVILILVTKCDLYFQKQKKPGSCSTSGDSGSTRQGRGEVKRSGLQWSNLFGTSDSSGNSPARATLSPLSDGGGTLTNRLLTATKQAQSESIDRSSVGFPHFDASIIRPARNVLRPIPSLHTLDSSEGIVLSQIAKLMSHPALLQKNWCAFYCSAFTGNGLPEAFSWFVQQFGD